jgi:hypothetical protein
MIKHILTASHEDLQAEAERISLLDEPDREEAILELLQELQEQAESLSYSEYEDEGFDEESSYDEDSLDPDTYEREDDSMELVDDPFSV